MVRAKISAFMEKPDTVYRRYPLSDTSVPARYAHAIATYRHGDLRDALIQIDALILFELLDEPIHDPLVEVVSTEVGVAVCGLHFEDAFA